jgi:four helix bundle protein
MKENPLKDKSFAFALRSVKLARHLKQEYQEYDLSRQLLRCGTSIGANVREAQQAESKADFAHKMAIALKEADETCYWLELLHQAEYITEAQYRSIYADAQELMRLLVATVKSARNPK